MDKLIEKLPSWAIAVSLFGVFVILIYMLATGTKVQIGGSIIGFLDQNQVSIPTTWSGQVDQKGYGSGNHISVTKKVNCTSNSVVTGISVEHGGTCRNQCNADGGIIKEIILHCHKLAISPSIPN